MCFKLSTQGTREMIVWIHLMKIHYVILKHPRNGWDLPMKILLFHKCFKSKLSHIPFSRSFAVVPTLNWIYPCMEVKDKFYFFLI